ncbi:MAG TPA: DUF5107 domain-containing protein [Segeticoccus sp.]|nr:DUF5107 domain-containing protein [Segeticoccus sp.]
MSGAGRADVTDEDTLRVTTLRLPCAPLAGEDPLPPVDAMLEAPFELADVPAGLAEGASFGHPRSMYPYLLQDRYGRDRVETDLTCVVLENEHLRAEVLPQLGGRVWSLTDTASGRELLHRNATVQPANFGLRNAWFAGGLEWNIGTRGHSPQTCSALHAATVTTTEGHRLLRMWELERVRGVVYQVDLRLPPGSRALWVHVRIQNPGPDAVPMYWWSNAAVPEAEDVRVLAPATRAYATSYDGRVRVAPVPVHDGVDATWPTRLEHAADYFYDVDGGRQRPWVAAVDSSGHGLGQVSTERLRGRKMFCWGRGTGGRRWQRWLSPGAGDYLEIQAGLAATQHQHLWMPAGASWSWVEAYGDVAADPALAHGDWSAAAAHLTDRIDALAPPPALAEAVAVAEAAADLPPGELLCRGSGWGALEAELRSHDTGPSGMPTRSASLPTGAGVPFAADTMGAEQELWRAVLTGGSAANDALREADPQTPPVSYVAGRAWPELLSRCDPCWARDYHLAVIAHAGGDLDGARRHYEASLADVTTAWALRGLGRISGEQGRSAEAAELLARAARLVPGERSLLFEAVAAALDAGDGTAALALVDAAPEQVRRLGRVRLLEARAAAAAGDADRVEAVLASEVVIPDLREGDTALSDLWSATRPGEPVPEAYDFRMR